MNNIDRNDIFKDNPSGVIPISSIWEALKEKTSGHINQFKEHKMETEAHGTVYKTTVSKTLRDRFDAKDHKPRNSKQRSLMFDIEETIKHLHNYTKETSPVKISCSLIISDSSDSSDSNGKNLFARFVEPIQNVDSEINHSQNDVNVIDKEEDRETKNGYRF